MKGLGPFLNRDMGGFDRPRSLFSNMPIGMDFMLDYHYYFNDFTTFLNGTGSLGTADGSLAAAALSTTDTYTDAAVNTAINAGLGELQVAANQFIHYVKDSGATVLKSADAENGVLVLTSAATTDDDGAAIQLLDTTFLVKSGKKLWFEARVKVSDADQCDMFCGLANEIATNPEDLWATGQARVGFRIADGDASIKCTFDDDTSLVVDVDSTKDASDDTFVKLGMRTDGGSIRYYINRALVHTASIDSDVAAVTMCPAFGGISGNNSGTHTRSIDYIFCAQER
jgi:hypothetical protein